MFTQSVHYLNCMERKKSSHNEFVYIISVHTKEQFLTMYNIEIVLVFQIRSLKEYVHTTQRSYYIAFTLMDVECKLFSYFNLI